MSVHGDGRESSLRSSRLRQRVASTSVLEGRRGQVAGHGAFRAGQILTDLLLLHSAAHSHTQKQTEKISEKSELDRREPSVIFDTKTFHFALRENCASAFSGTLGIPYVP